MRPASAIWALSLILAGCNARDSALAQSHQPAPPGISAGIKLDPHLLVDQFGYRPGDQKIAVIRNPHVGFDSGDEFSPGPTYEVRSTASGNVVFTGKLSRWNDGQVEPSSGDQGWWFDFSALDQAGSYFIFDTQRQVRSPTFLIDPDVYRKVLRAAMRMFYYQRSGFAKQQPYADACWTDDAAYVGENQDVEAHDITDPDNPAKVRNLSGGWFDAGDTNKYVTFAIQPVHQLLTAYQENPRAFTDDFGIPESGNGIPDVIDEVKWEIDWLQKMQYPDGSAALKVGETVYAGAAPPSSDHSPRFYIPSCTSATIAVAGMFAHASYVFGKFPALSAQALGLHARAVAAWKNYQGQPDKQAHCDTGVVHAGNADMTIQDQSAEAVVASVYLFAISGDAEYDSYLKAHYRELRPYHDAGWSRYAPEQGEALLFYTTLPQADPQLRATILGDKLNDIKSAPDVYGAQAMDLYRAYMPDEQYHWGSNNPHAQYGNTNMDVLTYDVDANNATSYRERALGVLHYFHGVNPFGMVYLSNMYAYGATRAVDEIYHAWFAPDTPWSDALTSRCGPAPGYVPGGPNVQAAQAGVPATLTPPVNQPPQKSFKDWNVGSPENSWAITEPGIYYQSAYIELLARFVQ